MARAPQSLIQLPFSAPPSLTVWCKSLDICGLICQYDKAMIRRVGQDYNLITSSLDLKLHLSENEEISHVVIRDDGKEFMMASNEGGLYLVDMDNLKNEVLFHRKLSGTPPRLFNWLQFPFSKEEWQDDVLFEGKLMKVPSLSKERKLMSKMNALRSRNCFTLLVTSDNSSRLKLWINFDFLAAQLSLSQFLMKQGVGIFSSGLETKSIHLLQGARSMIAEIVNQAKTHFLLQLDCQLLSDRLVPYLSNIAHQISLISVLIDYTHHCIDKAHRMIKEATDRIRMKLELLLSATREVVEEKFMDLVDETNIREEFQVLQMTGRVTNGMRSYLKDFVESQQLSKIHEFTNQKLTGALDTLSQKLKHAIQEVWLRLGDLERRSEFRSVYGLFGIKPDQVRELVNECENLIVANEGQVKEIIRMQDNLTNFLAFIQSRGKIFVDPALPVDSKNPLKGAKLNNPLLSQFLESDEQFNFVPALSRFSQDPQEEVKKQNITTRSMAKNTREMPKIKKYSMPSLIIEIKQKLGAYLLSRIPEAVARSITPAYAVQLNSTETFFQPLATAKTPDNNSVLTAFVRGLSLMKRKVLVFLKLVNLRDQIIGEDQRETSSTNSSFESSKEPQLNEMENYNSIAIMELPEVPNYELKQAGIHREDCLILLYEGERSRVLGFRLAQLNWQPFLFKSAHISNYVANADTFIKLYIEEFGVQSQIAPFMQHSQVRKLHGLSCGSRRVFTLLSEANEVCYFEIPEI